MTKALDLSGQKFEKLTALTKNTSVTTGEKVHWNCVCDCGKHTVVSTGNLQSKSVRSCGCLQKEAIAATVTTHGKSGTPTYNIWKTIKQRTTNPKNTDYKNYGAKGIGISDEWNGSFEAFSSDMGPRPSEKHSVERKNNKLGYHASNCFWATPTEQANNKTTNVRYAFGGKQKTVAEIAAKVGVNYEALRRRLIKGQIAENAVMALKLKQM